MKDAAQSTYKQYHCDQPGEPVTYSLLSLQFVESAAADVLLLSANLCDSSTGQALILILFP
jgi:hypothetical protein